MQALNLPSHTFSALQLDSGMYSSHCLPEGSTVATCTSLAFVFRTPQLKDCSIGGLSVSYDFKHDTTTALILGYAFDIKALDGDPTKTPRSLAQFVRQLFDCHLCWGHPLLLPCIFLVEHAQRVQKYATGILSRRVVLVEHSIGVTKTGRSGIVEYDFPNEREHANDQMLFVDGHMQRQNAKKLVGTSTWSQARRHCWMADDYEGTIVHLGNLLLTPSLQSTNFPPRSSSLSALHSGMLRTSTSYRKYSSIYDCRNLAMQLTMRSGRLWTIYRTIANLPRSLYVPQGQE